ncbi:Na+ channel auxiliary subunit TipE [Trinorchestia longiramus]|nr:Na+ channel auxiliary subunit TipE [Trinorchestia longiramus]
MLVPTQQALNSSKADASRPTTAEDRERLDQGKLALKKLLADKRRARSKRLKCVDYIRIYGTIVAGLIIIAAFSVLLFLVPMKIDPAWATLTYEFYPTPVVLTVENVSMIVGLSNVDWCSCTEGCTRDIFGCFKIIVSYKPLPAGRYIKTSSLLSSKSSVSLYPDYDHGFLLEPTQEKFVDDEVQNKAFEVEEDSPTSEYEGSFKRVASKVEKSPLLDSNKTFTLEIYKETSPGKRRRIISRRERSKRDTPLPQGRCQYCPTCDVCNAKLLVNVKGCGYPPAVNCSEFLERYGKPGRRLPGYYSAIDPTIALVEYSEDSVKQELGEAVGYTFGMMALGILVIVVLQLPYKKFWKKFRGKKRRHTSEAGGQFRMVAKHFAHTRVADRVSKVAARMIRINREARATSNFSGESRAAPGNDLRGSTSTVTSTISDGVATISHLGPQSENDVSGGPSVNGQRNSGGRRNPNDKSHLTFARMPLVEEYPFSSYSGSNSAADSAENSESRNFQDTASGPQAFLRHDFPLASNDWFSLDDSLPWNGVSEHRNNSRAHFNHNFVEFPEQIDRSGRFPVNKW